MIEALLKGKLSRQQENMEDVLTSLVLGEFRRLPAKAGLIPFLKQAELVEGSAPTISELDGLDARYSSYEFWPSWPATNEVPFTEPDVVIHLASDAGQDVLLLIEAKYRSGKSSEADESQVIRDQLAREWVHLCASAKEIGAIPWLVYLTADYYCPDKSVADAKRELCKKLAESDPRKAWNISWLTWLCLPKLLNVPDDNEAGKRLCELGAMVKRLGLDYLHANYNFEKLPESGYRYVSARKQLKWSFMSIGKFNWEYQSA